MARGGNAVELWALEDEVVSSINNEHENKMYLPGYKLDSKLKATNDIRAAATGKDFIILATPSLFLESTIKKFADLPDIQNGTPIIGSVTKGFVPSSSNYPKLILETMEEALPLCYKDCTVYVAGPSHAEEVALGNGAG